MVIQTLVLNPTGGFGPPESLMEPFGQCFNCGFPQSGGKSRVIDRKMSNPFKKMMPKLTVLALA
jgi:hypothetical protein